MAERSGSATGPTTQILNMPTGSQTETAQPGSLHPAGSALPMNWLPARLIRFKECVVNVDGCAIMRCTICGKSPIACDDEHYYGVDTHPICSTCWKRHILTSNDRTQRPGL